MIVRTSIRPLAVVTGFAICVLGIPLWFYFALLLDIPNDWMGYLVHGAVLILFNSLTVGAITASRWPRIGNWFLRIGACFSSISLLPLGIIMLFYFKMNKDAVVDFILLKLLAVIVIILLLWCDVALITAVGEKTTSEEQN